MSQLLRAYYQEIQGAEAALTNADLELRDQSGIDRDNTIGQVLDRVQVSDPAFDKQTLILAGEQDSNRDDKTTLADLNVNNLPDQVVTPDAAAEAPAAPLTPESPFLTALRLALERGAELQTTNQSTEATIPAENAGQKVAKQTVRPAKRAKTRAVIGAAAQRGKRRRRRRGA